MNIKNLLKGEITQSDLLNWHNATIVYDKMPIGVYGYVFNHDGVNFIMVEQDLTYYKKRKTILHELAHIELNQLCQADKDMLEFHRQDYEDEADRYIKFIKENLDK